MTSQSPEVSQGPPRSPQNPKEQENTENKVSSPSLPQVNAFTKLMAPKRKSTPPPSPPHKKVTFTGRGELGAYIASPTTYPPTRVISHTPSFVSIHDKYPKSSVHALLLPRSQEHTKMHPFDAFNDPDFLAACKAEAEVLKHGVALELRRLYGKESVSDRPMEEILSGEKELENGEMPKGRDWEKDVMVGIHAVPSMEHLHIHVLSVDRYSEMMNRRKHYNSFNTPFFVRLEEFPLKEGDERRRAGTLNGFLKGDLKCWRCGMNFGNRFAGLKEHLEVEFEEWKRE